MGSHSKKNIDSSLKSRIKRIFSTSKLTDEEAADSSSVDSDLGADTDAVMEATLPTKPQRKSGKSRKSIEKSTDKPESFPAEVHGQYSGAQKSQDGECLSNVGPCQQQVTHLAEIAQLTIQNERLCKENQLLRKKNLNLLAKDQGQSSSPQLRFNQEGRQDPPTIESLLLDRELLENLVWRLNVELGRYETRLQQLEKEFIPEKYNNASEAAKNTSAPAWCRADPATLGPLLQAYDEALLEKDQLINNFEQQLHKLGAEFREEVAENERLHEALEELLKKESDAREEAELAQKDVNNLHSENVILLEKLEVEKTKNEEMGEDYGSKLAQMQEHEALVIQKTIELNALRREYGILEQKLAQTTLEMEQRIPAKHHEDSIADCRKLLDQLKISYNEDRKVLEERNKILLVEKVNAETKIRSLVAEAAQNEARVQALEKLLRRTEARSEQLQMRLVGAESCRDSSVRELRQLMAVAERLAADQETLLQQLQLHQGTNRRLSALRTSLKSVQKELPEIERQLKAQESGVERLRGDHQREMVRLHSLLRHKDQAIKQLQQERDSTCEQLDIVWRAAEFESLKFADKGLCQPHSLPETHRKISRED